MVSYVYLADPRVAEFDPGSGHAPVISGQSTPVEDADVAAVVAAAQAEGVPLIISVSPIGPISPSPYPPSPAVLAELIAEVRTSPHAVSTDGTDSLPAPTGAGLEFVITAAGLDDIRYGGTSL